MVSDENTDDLVTEARTCCENGHASARRWLAMETMDI
jgi:hypothetical protein